MSELSHLCRGEGYRACDDARKRRYIKAPVPPQRYALKPPRQFQPQVIQRLGFELFCPALAEVEV